MPRQLPRTRELEIKYLVAARLRGLLASREHPHEWLAERLGPGETKSTVGRLVGAKRPITVELVERIAAAFEMHSVEFMCEGADPVWLVEHDAEAFRASVRQKFMDAFERQMRTVEEQFVRIRTSSVLAQVEEAKRVLEQLQRNLYGVLHANDPTAAAGLDMAWVDWVHEQVRLRHMDAEEAEALIDRTVRQSRQSRQPEEITDGGTHHGEHQ